MPHTQTDHILTSVENNLMTIRMNRADKKNALTEDMYARFASALSEAENNNDVAAVLILGHPGVFSAGNDIQSFLAFATKGGLATSILDFLRNLVKLTKPIVAGVDGIAIGVGTTMLLHCDMVYASPRAMFRTPFVDLALVPEAASSLVAPRVMGHARAFELLCLGAPFSPQRALDAGFVNHIVSEEALEATARKTAEALAKKPREALKTSRTLVRGDRGDILARIDEEAAHFAKQLRSPEAMAAFTAFMSKGK